MRRNFRKLCDKGLDKRCTQLKANYALRGAKIPGRGVNNSPPPPIRNICYLSRILNKATFNIAILIQGVGIEKGARQLAVIYANRSAVLFQLDKFKLCLQDIKVTLLRVKNTLSDFVLPGSFIISRLGKVVRLTDTKSKKNTYQCQPTFTLSKDRGVHVYSFWG